jgi:hypothetical protein
MNLNIGKIRITEEIDRYDSGLLMFKFKQNKIEYHCISIQLLNEREGYLVFFLSKELADLFKKSDYSIKGMQDLFKEKIEEFYFVSFQDEDPETQVIEYCGFIEKEEVFKLFNIK